MPAQFRPPLRVQCHSTSSSSLSLMLLRPDGPPPRCTARRRALPANCSPSFSSASAPSSSLRSSVRSLSSSDECQRPSPPQPAAPRCRVLLPRTVAAASTSPSTRPARLPHHREPQKRLRAKSRVIAVASAAARSEAVIGIHLVDARSNENSVDDPTRQAPPARLARWSNCT